MAQANNDKILEIDPLQLDKEWLNQPILYNTWAKELADAKKRFDEAKNEVEVTRAEIELAIRNDPDEFGISKVTESTVTAAIATQDDLLQVQMAMRSAKHRVDIVQAMVNSLDHRKRALENLVHLLGQDYFSEPRTKSDRDREVLNEASQRSVSRRTRLKKKKVAK